MRNIHPPAEPVDCNDCSETPRPPRNVWPPTGELVWQQEDLRIAGRGLEFVWTRTYRSRPESRERYWDHAYNLRTERTPDGIRVWTGTGAADVYRVDARGTFSARGVFAEGRLDAANRFHLRFSSGGVWEFRPLDEAPAAKGCIARIADRNGNALRFSYNAAGQLEVITDTLARDIRIGHDNAGRLTTITDVSGRRVSYRYGANGELTAVTYPVVKGTPTGNDFPEGATITYTYAPGQALIGITDRAGAGLLDVEYAKAFDHDRVSSLTWGRSGPPIHFTYHRIEEGSAVLLVIVNDGNGNVRELRFDKLDACIGTRSYTGRADPARPTTLTENRPASPLREGEPPFYETRFSYNADGLPTRIAFPDGSAAEKRYEIDLRTDARPIERGNLRSIKVIPGPRGGDQPELVRRFDYLAGFGCTCGQAFVTRDTDARGGARLTEYDDRGNAVSIVERDGSRTTLAYNAYGDLVSRSYSPDAAGAARRDLFEYSARHGQLTSEKLDAEGLALTTTYEHDDLGRLVLVRDPTGREHRTAWNAWDLAVRRTLPDSIATRPAVDDTLYDVNLNAVTRITRDAGREVTTQRSYDVLRRLQRVSRQIDPERRLVIIYEYDGNGNRVATRRGEAHVVRLSFDALDRPYRRSRGEQGKGYREMTFDYDAVGNLVQVTRGTGRDRSATRASYDGYSRLIRIDLPNGTAIGYSRDANGNALRQTVRNPRETAPVSEITQTFDAMDRVTRRLVAGRAMTESSEEQWQFDSRARLIRRVDLMGRVWRGRYDAVDRPIEIDDGSGRVTTFTYDANSNVLEEIATVGLGRRSRTRYVRDPRGRVLEVAGPRGIAHKYTYDADDRPGAIVVAGKQQLVLDYDGIGRPTRIRQGEPTGSDKIETSQTWGGSSQVVSRTDPNGNTTRYAFDAADNVVAIQYADGTKETSSFDSRGNCLRWTDGNGTSVVNSYDSLDRLVRREITPGGGVASDTTTETYQYDELGRLIRAANNQHTIERSYDGLSRVVTETQDGRQVRTTYRRGTRAEIGYPSGYRLEFDYEGSDLRRIRDARGVAIELDASGAIRYARTRGPVSSTVAWNEAGLPERLATTAAGVMLDERRYRWDDAANVTAVDVRDRRGERTISYKIDFLGRLRASTRSGGPTTEYQLDAAGNRTVVRVDGREGRYSMDAAADRATNRYTATPTDRRTYDSNGNLLTVTDAQGRRRSMRYDYLNRLIEYRDDATQTAARYSYDCLGRRLVKSVTRGQDRRQTRYFFDGDAVIEEQEETSGAVRSLVRHGRSVYGMATNEAPDRWFITDLLGTVVAECDESGAVTRTYDYDDYGQVTRRDDPGGAAPSPVSFAGYLHDVESGFYYVRTRYLEPTTGRFVTRDPSGIWEDGRNRGNAYAYAGNNPVAYLDPTGESTMTSYSCNGPWPGPRTITVEYEDCSKSRRQGLTSPVCRAFRASGQSQERVWNLWVNDFTGVAMPGAETTRSQVKFWFGGPDNKTNLNSKSIIAQTLSDVFVATKSDDFDIDCEGGGGDCASANAYVAWGGEDVNLCNNFFNSGFSNSKKASIIIHELTHAYNDTDDYFYYQSDGNNTPFNQLIETVILRENADCYEQFTLDFFLP